MTEFRVKIWCSKAGKSGSLLVKLCSLPPTNDAFVENINICHLQVAIWKAALLQSPLTMDPTNHGWELDHQGIRLPRTVPTGTLSAPADILNLIHCNCKTSGCLTAACSCSKIVFCLCKGWDACKNPVTQSQSDEASVEPDEYSNE